MNDVVLYLNKLFKKNDIVVVASSAGPDSMFLLHILSQLKNQLNLKIIVAHVNHKLRKESDNEALFVNKYAVTNNFIFEYQEVNEYQEHNLENEARKIRYNFFEELVAKYRAQYLLTAHHGDDLVETILMRLTRGSSIKGYGGFLKKTIRNDYILLRPLINFSKDEIINYMNDLKLSFFIDQSNFDLKYTRNRFRHNILPLLKKEDPLVHLKFKKFSEDIAELNTFLDNYLKSLIKDLKTPKGYDISKLLKLDEFLIKKIIEFEFNLLYQENIHLLNNKHTLSVLDLIKSSKGNSFINLPLSFIARKDYNYFKICYNKKEEEFAKKIEEVTIIPSGIIRIISNSASKNNNIIRISSKDIKLPLKVRNRQNGDIMEVKNLGGHKKIKDILIDEKVPIEKRALIPVVTDNENTIIWLPGVKKSKFDVETDGIYDIILAYEEEYNEH